MDEQVKMDIDLHEPDLLDEDFEFEVIEVRTLYKPSGDVCCTSTSTSTGCSSTSKPC